MRFGPAAKADATGNTRDIMIKREHSVCFIIGVYLHVVRIDL
jgi:hypothetical protein